MKKYSPVLFLGILWFSSCQWSTGDTELSYPKWNPQTKTVRHFGTEVEDPYANLMDGKDSTAHVWYQAQEDLAEDYFANNASTLSYLERFSELEDREGHYVSQLKQSENGWYFFLKSGDDGNGQRVYLQRSDQEDPTSLYDTNEIGEVTYLEPSYDGRYLAMGVPEEGCFASTIHFLEVSSEKLLPDKITNSNPDFGGIEWLPDSSGFVYLHFPVVDKGQDGYKKNSFSALYRIGHKSKVPHQVFGKGVGLDIPSDHYPKVKLGSSLDTYVIGYKASSSNFYDAYITDIEDLLSGRTQWRDLFGAEAQIFYNQGELRGNTFIYRQATSYGNRLCQVDLKNPDFGNPKVLAEGSRENPITKFEVTQDNIYFLREHCGVSISLFQLMDNKEINELQLPFAAGHANFFGESVALDHLGITLDGWTSDTKRYRIGDDGGVQRLHLDRPIAYPEFEGLVASQVLVPSYDGTEVPLSLIHPKELVLDGTHEVFVYVYGAYGDSMSPFFFPMFLDWAAQGGVLAFPHVRGGGEKGPDWHRQGQKALKHNSWKDLLACMDYLVEADYTQKGLIALYTNSAGGITAGMAVNERPELFSSLIAEFPRLHPYGLEASQTASSTSYMEYGSVRDSTEFHGLLRMDPYLNLNSDKEYPATLILTSYNDDRIPLWDNGKYVARRQASKSASAPILMDVDFESGHERLSGYDASIVLHSKIFGFAKTHMQN